jgi:ATP-dependent Lhr-like helicase
MAQQLLTRHGVVTRETMTLETMPGGFSAVYEVLKAMEDAGRVRRGYFVAGLGAAQFAQPAAVDLLRSLRDVPETPRTVMMSATDPANPYGAILNWPSFARHTAEGKPDPLAHATRSAGARVILVDGLAAAYIRRGERELLLCAPDDEPRHSVVVREVAQLLRRVALGRHPKGMLISEINGAPAQEHTDVRLFTAEGFAVGALGLQVRP